MHGEVTVLTKQGVLGEHALFALAVTQPTLTATMKVTEGVRSCGPE